MLVRQDVFIRARLYALARALEGRRVQISYLAELALQLALIIELESERLEADAWRLWEEIERLNRRERVRK